ncbi:DUF2913 family protein [Vibrio sp. SCSIO 43136]|uniref:DUF2913 family protein n=1 Tax=Vibrio sp. SCSIO 43136 TaxID=2819101 RepID=UPI0020759298|nr:DUF2913 family protein [Vibrio sp. SCSIO 43136]USD64167.1 DUF2913 family protein [Vibrio sp. SCSIO 43136]
MAMYHQEIQKLANCALEEMRAEHATGKLVNAPVSNNHFLVRWVTKALKTQRFDRCVGDDLTRWQKQGRSKGNQAGIERVFSDISAMYGKLLPADTQHKEIWDKDINDFIDAMEAKGWGVCTEYDLSEKIQLFTDGENSFALCNTQCDDCFETTEGDELEPLVKPMSWFVRGHHAEFVRLATEAGFLLHKVTDYKSKVKYHGEYLIYPKNHGPSLAEIPIGYQA